MIFEIDNVELHFRNTPILSGIYLKAETGKVTGILGSNGCGKSCLMEIIFGNLNPKHKLIRIDHKPILKPLYQTKLVKYLPQYSFLSPSFTLNNTFKTYNVDWGNFIAIFPKFENYNKLRNHHLSAGERRLVELYLVLKSPSKIVVLDEPFSHLAPLPITIIKTVIQNEKKNKIILITDHMYRHIIDSSDELYLLKNGCTKLINYIEELKDYNYLSPGNLL
jgi:ABC-type multidrug transport system ATPase subunit